MTTKNLVKLAMIVGLSAAAGCDDRAAPAPMLVKLPPTTSTAGMSRYEYLAADGGPHLLLPVDASNSWRGATSLAAALNPQSDYNRAADATANKQMAVIPVGQSSAMVLSDPPMTAWGISQDGLTEIYHLSEWSTTDLDALIDTATAAISTGSMQDSGDTLTLKEADAHLLYAGDVVTSVVYDIHRVKLPTGSYSILVGTYKGADGAVTVYRLRPR